MVAILTPAELKTHVETDLGDTALQRIIDAIDAEIIARCGALGTATAKTDGYRREIVLPRAAASISSVVEAQGSDWEVTLAADDYSLWPGGQAVTRLAGGTNPSSVWGPTVTVVFVPADDLARRRLALIDLAKIEIQYNGLAGERVGDYSSTSAKREEEREGIFRSIMPRRGWTAA